jgi:hypothetical protein
MQISLNYTLLGNSMENVTTTLNPTLWWSLYTFLNFCKCGDSKNKFGYRMLLPILCCQDEHCDVHIIFCTTNQKTLIMQQKLRLQEYHLHIPFIITSNWGGCVIFWSWSAIMSRLEISHLLNRITIAARCFLKPCATILHVLTMQVPFNNGINGVGCLIQ